jgi:hypothetical protein
MRRRQRHVRNRKNVEIHPGELMALWVYDNTVIHGGRRRLSWAHDSRTRRASHDDDWLQVPSRSQELSDHVSTGSQATSCNKSGRRSNAITDQDSIDDYPIIRVSHWWDLNSEARRINMIGHSNQEAINYSSKYLTIIRSTIAKCDFPSSSRIPPQLKLQHSPTAWSNLRNRSGPPLPNQTKRTTTRVDHRQPPQQIRNLILSSDRGIGLSFKTPSRKWSRYRSILFLYPDSYKDESDRQISFKRL